MYPFRRIYILTNSENGYDEKRYGAAKTQKYLVLKYSTCLANLLYHRLGIL